MVGILVIIIVLVTGNNLLDEISERSEPEGSSVDCRVLGRSVRRMPERRLEQIYANVSMENEVSVYSNMNAPTQPPTEPNTADDKDADGKDMLLCI